MTVSVWKRFYMGLKYKESLASTAFFNRRELQHLPPPQIQQSGAISSIMTENDRVEQCCVLY